MFAVSGAVTLFFFNDTATTEIYTLSLHDALPILDVEDTSREQTVNFFLLNVFSINLLTV